MKPILAVITLTAALVGPAVAQPAAKAYPTVSYTVHRYTCDAGKKLSVSYLRYGTGGPNFVVLEYLGRGYGLAQAPSADGARYAALGGLNPGDDGLEWWSKGLSGTLSTLNAGATKTAVAINCRTNR